MNQSESIKVYKWLDMWVEGRGGLRLEGPTPELQKDRFLKNWHVWEVAAGLCTFHMHTAGDCSDLLCRFDMPCKALEYANRSVLYKAQGRIINPHSGKYNCHVNNGDFAPRGTRGEDVIAQFKYHLLLVDDMREMARADLALPVAK